MEDFQWRNGDQHAGYFILKSVDNWALRDLCELDVYRVEQRSQADIPWWFGKFVLLCPFDYKEPLIVSLPGSSV